MAITPTQMNFIVTAITVIVSLIVVGTAIGTGYWYIVKRLKYKYKVVVFERIGNDYEPSFKDRGSEIKVRNSSETVFWLMKKKMPLPMPRIQTGRKTFWFAIRQDGEWQNFTMGDINAVLKKANIKFTDTEMRMSRVAIDRFLEDNYKEKKWLEKYGVLLFFLGYFVIAGVFGWLLFKEYVGVTGQLASNIGAVRETLETTRDLQLINKQIIEKLDLLIGNSGLRPA